jgi:hypothetical protein
VKYIKNYNNLILESRSVPNIVEEFISNNQDSILDSINNKDSHINSEIQIDNNKIQFRINLKYEFQNYTSNINFETCISSNFKNCIINLNIPKSFNDKLIFKSLSHELAHLYELYKISDIFDKSKWQRSKSLKIIDDFYSGEEMISYFRNLFYVSLKHEISAKVASLCIYLDSLGIKNKDQLIKELGKTTEWSQYQSLYNFNPVKYLTSLLVKYDIELILVIFNSFNKIMGIKTKLNNKSDILNYFKKTKRYFRSVCKSYKHKVLRYINDISETTNEEVLNINEDKEIKIDWRSISLNILLPEYLEFYS